MAGKQRNIASSSQWPIARLSLLVLVVLAFSTVIMCTGCDEDAEPSARQQRWEPDRAVKPLSGHKILLIHSYHREYEWVAGITRGVRRVLEPSGVQLEMIYMDTKRRTDQQWKEQSGKNALATIEQWDPDVVITADDNAQRYVASHLVGRKRPAIVFCGVNGEPEDYGFPAENVTGILERPRYQETVELLRALYPELAKMAIVTDNSPTSSAAVSYITSLPATVEIAACIRPDNYSHWKQAVVDVQNKADAICVYMYHTVARDDGSGNVTPAEVMAWTAANSKLPVVALFSFGIDDGALCGVTESASEHGEEAARIAQHILKGETVSDIPVISDSLSQSMLNMDTARVLELDVPADVLEKIEIIVGATDGQ